MRISQITTKEQAEKEYMQNMRYERGNEREKILVLRKYTKGQLIHIHSLLYGHRVYGDKAHIFNDIQRYFDNIERAMNL